jgi:hypothetical protein
MCCLQLNKKRIYFYTGATGLIKCKMDAKIKISKSYTYIFEVAFLNTAIRK